MSLEIGVALKKKGMDAAAEQRQKTLRLCRQYLYELAQTQETVTADDAQEYVERMDVAPLANAAGSLFTEKHWVFTGQWEPSSRSTSHAHKNRVWALRNGSQ